MLGRKRAMTNANAILLTLLSTKADVNNNTKSTGFYALGVLYCSLAKSNTFDIAASQLCRGPWLHPFLLSVVTAFFSAHKVDSKIGRLYLLHAILPLAIISAALRVSAKND